MIILILSVGLVLVLVLAIAIAAAIAIAVAATILVLFRFVPWTSTRRGPIPRIGLDDLGMMGRRPVVELHRHRRRGKQDVDRYAARGRMGHPGSAFLMIIAVRDAAVVHSIAWVIDEIIVLDDHDRGHVNGAVGGLRSGDVTDAAVEGAE